MAQCQGCGRGMVPAIIKSHTEKAYEEIIFFLFFILLDFPKCFFPSEGGVPGNPTLCPLSRRLEHSPWHHVGPSHSPWNMAACILKSELKSVLCLLLSCYKALGKGLNLSGWRVFNLQKKHRSPSSWLPEKVDQDSQVETCRPGVYICTRARHS